MEKMHSHVAACRWQDVEFDAPGDTNRIFRVKVTW